MKIPVKILLTDLTLPTGITWGDVIENWEAYMLEWQNAGILANVEPELPMLDMFSDEGVTLKEMLKDVQDPKLLFTEYSRSFTIPASKKNNRLFKHYYNVDIDNGFDARQLVEAKMFINLELYKVGNIALESVKMHNGKPSSYTVRFYGKLSDLGKAMGQDKLTDLPLMTLQGFNKQTKFTSTVKENVVFPLSSRFNRFKYNASKTAYDNVDKTKVVNYIDGTRNAGNYGIEPLDVLGAAKVGWLLDQIAAKYNLTFSGVLSQGYVRDLYLWLTNQEEDNAAFSAWAPSLSPTTSGFTGVSISAGSITFGFVSPTNSYNVKARATWTGNGKIIIYKNGAPVAESSTSNSYTPEVLVDFYSTITYKVETDSSQSVNMDSVVTKVQGGSFETFTDTLTVNSTTDYSVRANMPEMGVMEFLGSIFKLFNIVAIINEDRTVNTYHYDAYMATGSIKDITKYVNVGSYDVNVPNFYSGVYFTNKPAGTAIEEGYKTTASKDYGSLIYDLETNEGNRLNGSPYKLDTNISVLPLEHLTNGTALTSIVHTYFGDVSRNEVNVKAAFTYVMPSASIGLAWDNGSTVSNITTYLMPSNIYDPLHSASTTAFFNGLYWGDELRDFNPNTNVQGLGLYSCFYRGTVASLFDQDKRLVSVEAYLPQGFVKNFNLSDTLVISGNYFNVAELVVDYLTGKCNLKLIQVGRSQLPQWTVRTATSNTNSTGATVYITYLNSSGYLTQTSVVNGGTATFDCIGDVLRVSNSSLTFTYA